MKKEVICGDCLDFIHTDPRRWDCIFMDPPDNTKLKYNEYVDNRVDYYHWLMEIIKAALNRTPVLWVSYYYKHDLRLKHMLYELMQEYSCFEEEYQVRQFIWYFKFGEYRETDATSCYRPILRISGPNWKPVTDERVPSVREIMGDARATGKGRVPGDVWEFCRIQGNNKERRNWHPTQHPEDLYRRISIMSGGTTFLDLFGGTGTALRALHDKDVTIVDVSSEYCSRIMEEHNL
jgi:DNA modification methylase